MAINDGNSMIFFGGFLKRADLKGFRGFTLAEVLITLVIVGVIASMTIPTLMNNTNKQEYVSKLKKAYSTLSQATNKIISDNGLPRADIGGWATSSQAVYDMYMIYLSKAKECGGDTSQQCFASSYKRLSGGNEVSFDTYDSNSKRFVLADGTSVMIDRTVSDNCSFAHMSATEPKACAMMIVDVNGVKKPNQMGRDTFMFILREKDLYPAGCGGDFADKCDKTGRGWSCACKVLTDSKMDY